MGDKKEQGGEHSTSRGRGAQGQNLKPHAKKNVHSFNRINRISSVTEVGLHCVYTNMDCFLNKRLEFQMFVTTEQPDIICLTEILPKHFNYSVQKVELEVDGYDCFCKIEETDARRGVVIYVKKGLKAQELNFSAYETVKDTVWVKLQLEKGELLIGCISPSNKEDMNDQLYKLVKNAIQGRTHILLTGDFNHPEIDWENETSIQNDNHKATIFLESVVRDNFLYQHVKSPTHYRAEQTPTLIDLILTNEEGVVKNVVHSAPLGKSHHQVLSFDVRASAEIEEGNDEARNRARAVCRKAVKNYEKAIAREAQHNPKAFYAYANSKMKTKEGVADLLDKEGKTNTNNKEKANILNNFFCSVFTEENIKDMPECEDRHVKTELGDIVFIKDIVIKN